MARAPERSVPGANRGQLRLPIAILARAGVKTTACELTGARWSSKMTNMVRRTDRYVNIAEAKARLSDLVDKAANGEEILIARDHKPVARLVPLARALGPRKPGSAKGQVWMAPDFDAIPPDFRDYTT